MVIGNAHVRSRIVDDDLDGLGEVGTDAIFEAILAEGFPDLLVQHCLNHGFAPLVKRWLMRAPARLSGCST